MVVARTVIAMNKNSKKFPATLTEPPNVSLVFGSVSAVLCIGLVLVGPSLVAVALLVVRGFVAIVTVVVVVVSVVLCVFV